MNHLADSIGWEASLEDETGEESSLAESDAPSSQPVSQPPRRANPPASSHSNTNAGPRASLCTALGELKGTLATSPSATFNLRIVPTNGRPAEAVRLLEKYLEMTPATLDAGDVQVRIADLKSLLTLPGQNGTDIRRLYASAYGALAERKYDRALADSNKVGELAPEFALSNGSRHCFMKPWGTSTGRGRISPATSSLRPTRIRKTMRVCTSRPWKRSGPNMTRR